MGNSYELLKKFMKNYPMTVAWRLKQHCKVVDKHLNLGENILYIFAGQKNDSHLNILNTYVLVFTNKRIMVVTKRVVYGYFFKSITPDMYNDLTIVKGLIWGKVVIDTVKEVVVITNIDINALDDIETNITEIMLNQKRNLGIIEKKSKN